MAVVVRAVFAALSILFLVAWVSLLIAAALWEDGRLVAVAIPLAVGSAILARLSVIARDEAETEGV